MIANDDRKNPITECFEATFVHFSFSCIDEPRCHNDAAFVSPKQNSTLKSVVLSRKL